MVQVFSIHASRAPKHVFPTETPATLLMMYRNLKVNGRFSELCNRLKVELDPW